MKNLATLIKLHKRKVDDLKRDLGKMENEKSQLQLATENLKKELADEIALAEKQPEMGTFFGGFADRIRKREEQIQKEIIMLDLQMIALRDEISEAFGELKKFEIALDNAKQRQKENEARKEGVMLDDIAAQQHKRKETQ